MGYDDSKRPPPSEEEDEEDAVLVACEDEDESDGSFKDMYWVVNRWIVAEPPASSPTTTVFRLEEHELFDTLVQQLRRECPTLCEAGADELARRIAGAATTRGPGPGCGPGQRPGSG